MTKMRWGVLVVVVAVVALLSASTASAGLWNWGHNYLGNSSSNGLCPNWLPYPGSVCSGWNYWDQSHMHKHGGGCTAWGWVDNNSTGTYIDCGITDFYSEPWHFGKGPYIRATAIYESGQASYLQYRAYTCGTPGVPC